MTAVELLPVHQHVPEAFLVERGLTNYWGYNTIGFFAPHDGYSAAVRAGRPGGQVAEFQAMVAALHAAGLEVLLDVVFNHTAEGGRGADAVPPRPGQPRLLPARPGRPPPLCRHHRHRQLPQRRRPGLPAADHGLPALLAHRDGRGRVPLRPRAHARPPGRRLRRLSAFFDLVAQDPVVSRAKLIAEPWDVGQPDSYDVGRFPPGWSEWNGRYRDTMRDFWRRQGGLVGEFATRFSGSSDLYGDSRRRPTASVNFITVHDGFTLRDLVSYDAKHTRPTARPTGTGRRQPVVELRGGGPSDDPGWSSCAPGGPGRCYHPAAVVRGAAAVRRRRARPHRGWQQQRLLPGQPISWFDWSQPDEELLAFTRRLVALRRAHPVFRRRRFLVGMEARASWPGSRPSAKPMAHRELDRPQRQGPGHLPRRRRRPRPGRDSTPLLDDGFLVLVNGWSEPLQFRVPEVDGERSWRTELDAYDPGSGGPAGPAPGDDLALGPQSIAVFRSRSRRPVGPAYDAAARLARRFRSGVAGEVSGESQAQRRRVRVGLAAGELGNTELSQA